MKKIFLERSLHAPGLNKKCVRALYKTLYKRVQKEVSLNSINYFKGVLMANNEKRFKSESNDESSHEITRKNVNLTRESGSSREGSTGNVGKSTSGDRHQQGSTHNKHTDAKKDNCNDKGACEKGTSNNKDRYNNNK